MGLYGTFQYGSGVYYSGAELDKPLGLDFYRTDTDNLYVFYWMFHPGFISPSLQSLNYQLQLDTDPDFSSPQVYETTTEIASVVESGYSRSAAYASINISAGLALDINIDGDGVKTITLALNTSGNAIAADIQTKVRALTANNPSNQPAYDDFTATFDGTLLRYTLTSGSTGIGSTVVVSGGTAAVPLKLGLSQGGYEVRGNSSIFKSQVRRVLIVTASDGTTLTDVSATTNTPGPNQYIVSVATNQITFNDVNAPDTITIIYVTSASQDIIQYQRGNLAKGFTVPIYPRVESDRLTFYARVRIKNGLAYGPFSDAIEVRSLADVTRESADRLLQGLPDRHVYPVDESYKNLADRQKNISKVYEAYARELDRFFLEKENVIRDPRQQRTRDERLFGILGSRFSYPKPSGMEFVDYRIIVSNLKRAALEGGTYSAVKLVCAAFTGVNPTVVPLSQDVNLITASEETTVENVTVSVTGPNYTAQLSSGVRSDPIIPGSLLSGAVTSVSEPNTIPASSPFTVALTDRPSNIPTIAGFTYTTGTPAAGQFTVDYSTGVLSFNAADAGSGITVVYIPNYDVTADTININIDGDGVKTITLDGPFLSKQLIAENIQTKVRALTANNPSNQPAYNNFLAKYLSATDRFLLISGNTSPTSASSVVVSAGTAASLLKLRSVDGAVLTTGLAYQTPPGPPSAGSFTTNVASGDGSILTFEGVAESGKLHTVLYKKKTTVHSYLPHTITQSTTVPISSPYIITLTNFTANIPTIAGFTYTTGTPAAGQFTVDYATKKLTFNAANAGASVNIQYVPLNDDTPILYGTIEAGFGIKIILNNPGSFDLDRTNIGFLLKQVLPAYTKFILV